MRVGRARTRRISMAGAAVLALTMTIWGPTPAVANQSVVPSTFPLASQPRVMDGRIYSIDTRGNSVVVGGHVHPVEAGAGR